MLNMQNAQFNYGVNNKQKQSKAAFKANIGHDLKLLFREAQQGENPILKHVKPDFMERFIPQLIQKKGKPVMVGVTAKSGAGKTTVVEDTIKMALGRDIKEEKVPTSRFFSLVKGDNWFHDISEELKAAGSFGNLLKSGKNLDEPAAVDLQGLRTTIKKLSNGTPVKGPEYVFTTGQNVPGQIHYKPTNVIFTDSIFSLHPSFNPPKKPVLDVGMYVDVPNKELWKRFKGRAESRRNSLEEAKFLFAKTLKEARKHLNPQRADLVINGNLPREVIAGKLSKIFNAIAGNNK